MTTMSDKERKETVISVRKAEKYGTHNVIIGDYPGNPQESYLLVIGVKDNYFKYQMNKKEREQILAGLIHIGIVK